MWYNHWIDLKIKSYYWCLSLVLTLTMCLYYKDIPVFLITKMLLMHNKSFIFTKITTAFIVYFKLSISLSILLTLPLFLVYVYLFLLKSFYNYQLTFCKIISFILTLYYFIGVYSMYTLLFYYLISFLLFFERNHGFLVILLEAKLDEFVDFWTQIIISFLLLFFLLIVSLSLVIKQLLVNFYLRFYFWGIFYFIIITLTPPDIVLHFLIFLSFLLFFESTFYLLLFFKILWNFKFGESRIRTYDEY